MSESQPETLAERPQALSNVPKHILLERVQYSALCWTLFLAGWNDGSLGPLLPRIREAFHLGFTISSLLFVFAILGCLIGAMINVHLTEVIGFGKVLVFGSLLQTAAYALLSPGARLPFPVFVLGYTINGIGIALQDAQTNGYVAAMMRSPATKMGVIHAVYGLGALVSPLVATQFSQIADWSFHFLVSLGIAVLNTLLVAFVFRGRFQEECLSRIGQPSKITSEEKTTSKGVYYKIIRSKNVYLLTSFLFIYCGVETTVGGYVVSYVQLERNGGPNSGYTSAGFFGGLTLGRVLLLPVNKWVGERRVLFLYSLLCLGLQLVSWLVPSIYATAISTSLIGMFLGPYYPIAMNHAGRIIPASILTGSIGWIAGLAFSGGAVFPFITGALSGTYGVWALQPLVLGMIGAMFLVWGVVPKEANSSAETTQGVEAQRDTSRSEP